MRHNFKLKIKPLIRPRVRSGPLFIALAISLVVSLMPLATPPTQAKGCDDVQFIFARGSGESLGDKSFQEWQNSIRQVLQKSTLQSSFYELGSIAQNGYRYPAVSVSGSLGGFGNLLGAYVSRGEFLKFGQSVIEGSNELKSYLRIMSSACPSTKYVLGGYSQGAMVLSRTLDDLDSSRIVYVATFGDPKLYLPEGKGIVPAACLGKAHSNYRTYVPDCRAYEGILGSYRPYQPAGYEDKLGTWCNDKDLMCSSGASIDDHTSYGSGGLYAGAARQIKTRLKQAFPDAFSAATINPWASATHNVAFLFDTSVSMVLWLNGQRQKANQLAAQVLENGGSVAAAEFRDLDDPYEPRIVCEFGCNATEFDTSLKQLQTGGGGDDSESVLSALLHTMDYLDWQEGATKSIILFTDNDYLSPDRDGTTLAQVVQRSKEIDPVNVYVVTRREVRSVYDSLVSQTNGASFLIGDNDSWLDLSDTVLYRPEAALNSLEFSGVIGDEFAFDASRSSSSDHGPLRYDWDLDGDDIFEVMDGAAIQHYTYYVASSHYIQVRVTDSKNRSNTMTAKLTVSSTPPITPKIFDISISEISTSQYQVSYQTNADYALISLDDAPIGHLKNLNNSLTIDGIYYPTKLRLVPYISNIGRGEGIEIMLGEQLPSDSGPNLPLDTPGAVNPPTSNINALPFVRSNSQKTLDNLPKAPNAGIPKLTTSVASY